MKLCELGLAGLDLKVTYLRPGSEQATFVPQRIRLGPAGMFIEWEESPAGLEEVTVEWNKNPFLPGVWRCACSVTERTHDGVEVTFGRPAPTALREWFQRANVSLSRPPSNASLTTSKLYTAATVVSACGLFCGAAAMLLPIIAGSLSWIDTLAKVLLLVMVFSIAGFAALRVLAGRSELKAIRQDG